MKIKFYIFISVLILPFFISSMLVFAADDKANDIIKKVKNRYDDVKTLSAEFIQIFHWKLANNTHQQGGKIWLKGKESFRIETEDQTIVSDGKTIWTFSQFNNQVLIDNARKSGDDIRLPKDIFFKYSEQYLPIYLKDEKIENEDCYVIELRAKTEDIFIKYMKVWISMKMSVPVKIEQLDLNNNTRTYILNNIEINNTIKDDLFVFQIPESVEIIDMR